MPPEIAEELDFFLMANLSPRLTGLPFAIWISTRGHAKHDIRIKVSPNAKTIPEEMISVALRPKPHVVEGEMPLKQFELLDQWIQLNLSTLLAYWDGAIYTDEALAQLKSIA